MLKEGETLYLLDDKGRRHWFTLKRDMIKIEGLGVLDGNRIIGAENGISVEIAGRRFFVLRPGVAELMESIERNTQVIISKDAAYITHFLNLKCGDVVVEAGVGSGCLTIALLNAVQPFGKVISFELRKEFARARKNVMRSQFVENWELRVDDIKTAKIDVPVDAAVLDIPDPWEAVDNITGMLKGGGRFCAYVPNVNQLENTVKRLSAANYVEIRAFENLQRQMEVHEGGTRPAFEMLGHTGYLIFARKVLRKG
ncbi:MAG: tRNA (adenine-N1)-methyltransferase [Methanomassiliicoccales archaeon]|jgi:tRNA (adenine57-N1/adenine58-N1)-methyltransferase|nr:tRNA (adenine-N1)-methyltransferase [Methanomassiliicoccales archaeon]